MRRSMRRKWSWWREMGPLGPIRPPRRRQKARLRVARRAPPRAIHVRVQRGAPIPAMMGHHWPAAPAVRAEHSPAALGVVGASEMPATEARLALGRPVAHSAVQSDLALAEAMLVIRAPAAVQ